LFRALKKNQAGLLRIKIFTVYQAVYTVLKWQMWNNLHKPDVVCGPGRTRWPIDACIGLQLV
jgi:hypothetical protein